MGKLDKVDTDSIGNKEKPSKVTQKYELFEQYGYDHIDVRMGPHIFQIRKQGDKTAPIPECYRDAAEKLGYATSDNDLVIIHSNSHIDFIHPEYDLQSSSQGLPGETVEVLPFVISKKDDDLSVLITTDIPNEKTFVCWGFNPSSEILQTPIIKNGLPDLPGTKEINIDWRKGRYVAEIELLSNFDYESIWDKQRIVEFLNGSERHLQKSGGSDGDELFIKLAKKIIEHQFEYIDAPKENGQFFEKDESGKWKIKKTKLETTTEGWGKAINSTPQDTSILIEYLSRCFLINSGWVDSARW